MTITEKMKGRIIYGSILLILSVFLIKGASKDLISGNIDIKTNIIIKKGSYPRGSVEYIGYIVLRLGVGIVAFGMGIYFFVSAFKQIKEFNSSDFVIVQDTGQGQLTDFPRILEQGRGGKRFYVTLSQKVFFPRS